MIDFLEIHWASIIGSAIGILYLYLEYKANIWMWAASIVMAAFYIYIFYSTQLYASMSIYIYFFLASIYGWVMWFFRRRDKVTGKDIITRTPKKYIPAILISVTIIFIIIYAVLNLFSWPEADQSDSIFTILSSLQIVTIGDALTTSLNIVALWMIARKWADQWLLLIPANAISSLLLFIQNDIVSGIMFAIFFVVSIGGFRNWKLMTTQQHNISEEM
jgi:nicotinamide mononucleotide transporter